MPMSCAPRRPAAAFVRLFRSRSARTLSSLAWAALLCLVCVAGPGGPFGARPAQAKSYELDTVDQVVTLDDDGTLYVVDTRTFKFEGEFHNAFLNIDPAPGGAVTFVGVEPQDGQPVRNVRVEGNTLRWQYDARDQERVFRISYRLTGEVKRASDAALIDRQFVEPDHAPIRHYAFRFVTPRTATLLKAFIFTPTGIVGNLQVAPEIGRLELQMPDVETSFVRVRLLFDEAQVPGVASSGQPNYEAWLGETTNETLAFRSDSARRLAGRGERGPRKPLPTALAGLLALVAIGFSGWALTTWRRNGVEPTVGDVGPYFREPPQEIPPAVVPFVTSQQSPGVAAGAPALGATILDFARRKILHFEEHEKEKFLGLGGGKEIHFVLDGPPRDALAPFEQAVYDMLAEAGEGEGRVTPARFRAFFRRHTSWAMNWVNTPRPWYEAKYGPLLASTAGGYMFLFIFLGMVLMIGMLVVSVNSANPVVLVVGLLSAVSCGMFGIICGAAMPRWKPETLLRARQWKAYGRFLKDFSAMEEAPPDHYKMWDYHFIYATALGVSENYLANIKKQMKLHPEYFHTTPYWMMTSPHGAYGAGGPVDLGGMQASLDAVAANLSALNSALTTATSSGGGFSGGGAGGSSGGGGSSGAS